MTDKQSSALLMAISPGAIIPVDVPTTSALCAELRRLVLVNELLFDALHSIKNNTNDFDSYDTAKEAIEKAEAK